MSCEKSVEVPLCKNLLIPITHRSQIRVHSGQMAAFVLIDVKNYLSGARHRSDMNPRHTPNRPIR